MKKRQELICWSCDEQFSILLPEKDVDNLKHPCPYCAAECVVDFTPYPDDAEVYRGSESKGIAIGQRQLPDIIETQQAE